MTDDVCFWSARDQLAALRAKELSARELMRTTLERIAAVNPAVNAIVSLDEDRAMDAAAQADERMATRGPDGVLHGLPMAHKDTHVSAGIRTTHGSPLHAEDVPEEDELVVARMRAAGTVSVAKTNVPEFAAGSHSFNPIFGVTRNPYALDRSAGGSSGGAAAALATGMLALADGSDMGGSLRNPASFCNVVGLRPSPGRVPSHPTALPWSTLGVQGPMARDIDDLALLLSVQAGPDDRVPIALEEPGESFARPRAAEPKGLRVAWTTDFNGLVPVEPAVLDVLRANVQVFESLGCEVTEISPDLSGAIETFRTLRAWQFQHNFADRIAAHPDKFKPSVVANAAAGRDLSGRDLSAAEAHHGVLFERMRAFFTEYDVLLAPVSQVLPFDVELEYPTEVAGVPQEDYLQWMASVYVISITGSPALSIPGGFTPDGLPVGLQIIGPHRQEKRVLEVGKMFEEATGFARQRPDIAALAAAGPLTSRWDPVR
ncbi:MAG TPA: amidase [Beutenbergiaceae bacterium]|nr:amidase [Beutenbergiaceae bacterium]